MSTPALLFRRPCVRCFRQLNRVEDSLIPGTRNATSPSVNETTIYGCQDRPRGLGRGHPHTMRRLWKEIHHSTVYPPYPQGREITARAQAFTLKCPRYRYSTMANLADPSIPFPQHLSLKGGRISKASATQVSARVPVPSVFYMNPVDGESAVRVHMSICIRPNSTQPGRRNDLIDSLMWFAAAWARHGLQTRTRTTDS